jgi:hypothetical protein
MSVKLMDMMFINRLQHLQYYLQLRRKNLKERRRPCHAKRVVSKLECENNFVTVLFR